MDRRLIEAIDEYNGDDPLHPWIESVIIALFSLIVLIGRWNFLLLTV